MIPKESAKSFKIGTKKSGVDDVDYYVVKDKNGLKRWRKQGSWFVIYNINQESKKRYWYYPNNMFLGDWSHAGNGTTVPINKSWENVKYPLEEQFIGNPKYITEIKEKIKEYFDKLKERNVITSYRIVTSIELHKYMNKYE